MANRPPLKVYIPARRGEGVDQWEQWWAKEDVKALVEGFTSAPMFRTMQANMPRDGLLLEAGCGPGYFVHLMRRDGYAMAGLDFVSEPLRQAHRFDPSLPLLRGSVDALPLANSSVSGCYSGGVIEHFEDGPQQVLREAARVLRPGGVLVLTFPCANLYRRLQARLRGARFHIGDWHLVRPEIADQVDTAEWVFHLHLYDVRHVEPWLRAAGFTIVQQRRISFLRGMHDIGFVRRWLSAQRSRHAAGSAPEPQSGQRDVSAATPSSWSTRLRSLVRSIYLQLSADRLPAPLGWFCTPLLLRCFGHTAVFICRREAEDERADRPETR